MNILLNYLTELEILVGIDEFSLGSGAAESWRRSRLAIQTPGARLTMRIAAAERYLAEHKEATPKDAIAWVAETCPPEFRDQLRGWVHRANGSETTSSANGRTRTGATGKDRTSRGHSRGCSGWHRKWLRARSINDTGVPVSPSELNRLGQQLASNITWRCNRSRLNPNLAKD